MEYLYKVEKGCLKKLKLIRRKIWRKTGKSVFVDGNINYSNRVHKDDIGVSVFTSPKEALAAYVEQCDMRRDRIDKEYTIANKDLAEAIYFKNKELEKNGD